MIKQMLSLLCQLRSEGFKEKLKEPNAETAFVSDFRLVRLIISDTVVDRQGV